MTQLQALPETEEASHPGPGNASVNRHAGEVFHLDQLFSVPDGAQVGSSIHCNGAVRQVWAVGKSAQVTLDRFSAADVSICFLQVTPEDDLPVRFDVRGAYQVASVPAGGWILSPTNAAPLPTYWIPQPPMLRRLDDDGHILHQAPCRTDSIHVAADELGIGLQARHDMQVHCVVWRIPPSAGELLEELNTLAQLEVQPVFLWGSHSVYRRPADTYLHLVDGRVYESRWSWPHNRIICSENDAHALYVTMQGLALNTGKRVYTVMARQLLLAVIARQGNDGGWHHGTWTQTMESHYRLHCSAMHLLMDALQYDHDDTVEEALHKAAAFITSRCDQTEAGAWFLHDSLEQSEQGMNDGPFQWHPSRFLGKSPTNMLVLNTHLDTLVGVDRYQQVTGKTQHAELVNSARGTARAVIGMRNANVLYKQLFRAIYLTLLPTEKARELPAPVRALKRIAWKYIIPRLHKIKSAAPQLVMPGGYIDRAIGQAGLADVYQSINGMDLARYTRRFPDDGFHDILQAALRFTQTSGIREHWGETGRKRYALGFWAESLYHHCIISPDKRELSWLADAVLDLEDLQLGFPPSLLGGNCEAVAPADQVPFPIADHPAIRMVNLARHGMAEYLLVNISSNNIPVPLSARALPPGTQWETANGDSPGEANPTEIPARGWVACRRERGE